MKVHNPKLLGALVDGELKGVRRFFVERHLHGCALCAREYRQLRRVRTMLQSTAADAPVMSDSPEFFWMKVKRQVQAQDNGRIKTSAAVDSIRQQQFVLTTCAAVVVAVLAIVWTLQHRTTTAPSLALNSSRRAAALVAKVENVSTAIPDTDATALDTDNDNVAVIWVSGLPWTADMTEMKTHYANLDI
jgi:anti-sigma factor RsiW